LRYLEKHPNAEGHKSNKEKQEFWQKIADACHLTDLVDFQFLENPNMAAAVLTRFARGAGLAARDLAEALGKKSEASRAQIEEENAVFEKVNQALATSREDQSFNALHDSLGKVIRHAARLRAEANTAKAASKLAIEIGGPAAEQEARNHFIAESVLESNQKAEEAIMQEIIDETNKGIFERM
jgi:hypothetical protein